MRFSELREKEVINCDLAFDVRTGCLEALIVPGPCKLFGFLGHDQEYIIPFKCICQIGCDIILVDIRTVDCLKKPPEGN